MWCAADVCFFLDFLRYVSAKKLAISVDIYKDITKIKMVTFFIEHDVPGMYVWACLCLYAADSAPCLRRSA